MKSIRLNNEIRDAILEQIKLHIEEKYEKNKITLEFEEEKTKFTKELTEEIKYIYGKDIGVLRRLNLGETVKSFYLRFTEKDNIRFSFSKPFFYKIGWIVFELQKHIFIPLSKNTTTDNSYGSKHTIVSIIQNTPNLFTSFKWINQINCDIETEKQKIIQAYNNIIRKHNTTKQILEKHPSMQKFMSFLDKEPALKPTEVEKLIEKFETEG